MKRKGLKNLEALNVFLCVCTLLYFSDTCPKLFYVLDNVLSTFVLLYIVYVYPNHVSYYDQYVSNGTWRYSVSCAISYYQM